MSQRCPYAGMYKTTIMSYHLLYVVSSVYIEIVVAEFERYGRQFLHLRTINLYETRKHNQLSK